MAETNRSEKKNIVIGRRSSCNDEQEEKSVTSDNKNNIIT